MNGMRGTLALVSFAVTAMVAVSFLLPLGLVVKQIARDRALTGAERQAASLVPVLAITTEPDALADAVASTEAGADGRLALHLPGAVLGTPRVAPSAVATARDGGRAFPVELRGGQVLLRPVVREGTPTAVIEVFVPRAELSRGVTEAWLTLAAVALALGVVAVAMGDRLATRVVRSSRRLADAAGRVARANWTCASPRTAPANSGRPRPRSTRWPGRSLASSRPNGKPPPTCRTGSAPR
nr:hypothetical protein [Actinomadura sp. CNU-125]